jgi:hypothetical protein
MMTALRTHFKAEPGKQMAQFVKSDMGFRSPAKNPLDCFFSAH